MSDPNLTEALSQKNPKAYAARFKRLLPGERSAFERALAPSAYFHHARALGETPAVGVDVMLDQNGALVRLQLTFGALSVVRDQQGWDDAVATLAKVLEGLPSEVGVAGHAMLPSDAAKAEAFFDAPLGWKASEVHFTTTDLSDGGRIRFAFVEGVVIVSGSTGRGEFRAHVGIATAPERFEAQWQALAARRSVAWRRS
jgi:hypothetical protein